MNRIVVFGVAMFFALVGIALIGGEQKASAFIFGRFAGYSAGGCDGCSGCNGGCHGGCHHNRCHGRCNGGGCHHNRCHGRDRCHGRCHGGCNGGCCNGGGCCGGYADVKGGAVQAPMGPEKQVPGAVQAPAK